MLLPHLETCWISTYKTRLLGSEQDGTLVDTGLSLESGLERCPDDPSLENDEH